MLALVLAGTAVLLAALQVWVAFAIIGVMALMAFLAGRNNMIAPPRLPRA